MAVIKALSIIKNELAVSIVKKTQYRGLLSVRLYRFRIDTGEPKEEELVGLLAGASPRGWSWY